MCPRGPLSYTFIRTEGPGHRCVYILFLCLVFSLKAPIGRIPGAIFSVYIYWICISVNSQSILAPAYPIALQIDERSCICLVVVRLIDSHLRCISIPSRISYSHPTICPPAIVCSLLLCLFESSPGTFRTTPAKERANHAQSLADHFSQPHSTRRTLTRI